MSSCIVLTSQILNLVNLLLTFLFGIMSEFILSTGAFVDVVLKGICAKNQSVKHKFSIVLCLQHFWSAWQSFRFMLGKAMSLLSLVS